MSDDLDKQSFNKSYKVLKETADWLSGPKEPDIDQLVSRDERAMRAYSICKDRLDKVQATLGRFFEDDQLGSVRSTDAPEKSSTGARTVRGQARTATLAACPPHSDSRPPAS